MTSPFQLTVLNWLKGHPGIFSHHEEGDTLRLQEGYSQKDLSLRWADIERMEEKVNPSIPGQTYLVLRFHSGRQLVLSLQGFVFPPDFANTGPIPLPSPVYCMQDFNNIFSRLQHVASEEDRRREALDLITVLIAILDGAKAVGLEMDREIQEVEKILSQLEKGSLPPPPHRVEGGNSQ